jgi:hypothetical protein
MKLSADDMKAYDEIIPLDYKLVRPHDIEEYNKNTR